MSVHGLFVDLPDSTLVGGESDGELASFISLRELVEEKESEPRVKTERVVKLEKTECRRIKKRTCNQGL